MTSSDIYAEPRHVESIEECYFYHTMELPISGLVSGEWDLRHGMNEYFGGVNFEGKRVLEVGTASGFCCFWMERQGADVVSYDLSKDHEWDVVPYFEQDWEQILAERRIHVDKINNAWWLAHREYESRAKAVYGNIYQIPKKIGPVDICTLSLVLPHVRDPFHAMHRALSLARETAIIVGSPNKKAYKRTLTRLFSKKITRPGMFFWPDFRNNATWDTWWSIPEETMIEFLGVLGFTETKTTYHYQQAAHGKRFLYTIVGHRSQDR